MTTMQRPQARSAGLLSTVQSATADVMAMNRMQVGADALWHTSMLIGIRLILAGHGFEAQIRGFIYHQWH